MISAFPPFVDSMCRDRRCALQRVMGVEAGLRELHVALSESPVGSGARTDSIVPVPPSDVDARLAAVPTWGGVRASSPSPPLADASGDGGGANGASVGAAGTPGSAAGAGGHGAPLTPSSANGRAVSRAASVQWMARGGVDGRRRVEVAELVECARAMREENRLLKRLVHNKVWRFAAIVGACCCVVWARVDRSGLVWVGVDRSGCGVGVFGCNV